MFFCKCSMDQGESKMTIVSLQVSESPVQVACEALGRMPNWQAAVQHLKSLTSRLQEIQCPRLLGR